MPGFMPGIHAFYRGKLVDGRAFARRSRRRVVFAKGCGPRKGKTSPATTKRRLAGGAGAALRKRHDARQFRPAEPFEEGAPSGRDVGQIAGDADDVERPHRIPAAGDTHELPLPRQAGDLAGKGEGALAERRRLEGAERPVP